MKEITPLFTQNLDVFVHEPDERARRKKMKQYFQERSNENKRKWPTSMHIRGIFNGAAFFKAFPEAATTQPMEDGGEAAQSRETRQAANMFADARKGVEAEALGTSISGMSGILGQHVLGLQCILQFEGGAPGKYDGPLAQLPYFHLTPEWRVEASVVDRRRHQIVAASATKSGFRRCFCGAKTPSRATIERELEHELYHKRLARLEDVDFKYFIDGESNPFIFVE